MRRPGKRFGFASNSELRWDGRDDKRMRNKARKSSNKASKWVAPSRRLRVELPTDDQFDDDKEVKGLRMEENKDDKSVVNDKPRFSRLRESSARKQKKQRPQRFLYPALRRKNCRHFRCTHSCVRMPATKSLTKCRGKYKDPFGWSKEAQMSLHGGNDENQNEMEGDEEKGQEEDAFDDSENDPATTNGDAKAVGVEADGNAASENKDSIGVAVKAELGAGSTEDEVEKDEAAVIVEEGLTLDSASTSDAESTGSDGEWLKI